MWVIRAYDRDTDELVDERELERVTSPDLAALLGFAPTPLGSTPLDRGARDELARRFALNIKQGAEYFLDFDAEPETVHGSATARSAAGTQ